MKYNPSMMHVLTETLRKAMGCKPIRVPNPEQGAPKAVVCTNLKTGEVVSMSNCGALDTYLNKSKNYVSGVLLSYEGWINDSYFICEEKDYDPMPLDELNKQCQAYWKVVKAEREKKAKLRREERRLAIEQKRQIAKPAKVEETKGIVRLTSDAGVVHEFSCNKEAAHFLGTQQSYVGLCRRKKRYCHGYRVEVYYMGKLVEPVGKKKRVPLIRPIMAIKYGVSTTYKNVPECSESLNIDTQRIYYSARTNTLVLGYLFKFV